MLMTSTLAELPIPLSAIVKIGVDKVEQLWTERNATISSAKAEAEADLRAVRLAFNAEKERINTTYAEGDALDYHHTCARLTFERQTREIVERREYWISLADRGFLLAIICELSPRLTP